jgi:hypothetical protein
VRSGDTHDTSAALARLGRYQILQKLGQGGMGEVYLAQDTELGRRVALKVLPTASVNDPAALARFRREARALAQLSHPGIVQAFDTDSADGRHFLVLEYVEGWSLSRVLREHGRLPPVLAADYVRQAALGLQHAHEKGLVHRDLKPSNLLVNPQGQVKLLDLGLARFLQDQVGDAGLTREGSGMGTPDYCAPEQFHDARHADARSDVYALGCTLYHLLTGSVPFPGSSLSEKAQAHAEQEPTPVAELCPEVPVGLALAVRRMMAKRPRDRFRSAGEVAEALAPHVPAGSPGAAGLTSTATWESGQLTLRDSRGRAGRRRRWAVVGAGALAACLLALLAWSVVQPGGEGDRQEQPKAGGPQTPAPEEAAPEDPNVLTVARDGTGRFRTLTEALAKVDRPGMTVRILDAGVYAEALQVEQAAMRGLTLEAPRRATLAAPPRTKVALQVGNVADVTVRGLRVRAGPEGAAAVKAYGRTPGLLLDGLEVDTPAGPMAHGIHLESLDLTPQDPPAVVRNCTVRPGSMGGIQVSGNLGYRLAHPCRRVIVRDNQVEKCWTGVNLVGSLQHVQVVGNRIWGSTMLGIQLDNLLDGTEGILVANNTLLNCPQGLRLWDSEVKGKGVQICNNLILGTKLVDMLFTDSGGNPLNERGPGDGKAVRGRWRVEYNWREGPEPRPGVPLRQAWIPADPPDVLRDRIEVTSRTPGDPGFLRPRKDSRLGIEGAGRKDPALPAYVGALPPEGAEGWDWHRTWLAPPPGKLLTVSQSPEDGGEYRSIGAAVAKAEPWATIRVLDDATYEERILLDDPARHRGLALEAPRGATLEMPSDSFFGLAIRGVPHVRVKGFRFRAAQAITNSAFIQVTGSAAGVTLERLAMETKALVSGVWLEKVRVLAGEEPVVVRDCTMAVAQGVLVTNPADANPGSTPYGGVAVLQNRVRAKVRGITVQGASARVLVGGNLVWDSSQAGLQVEDPGPRSAQIVFANNTAFDNLCDFRLWHNHPEERLARGQVEFAGNLFLEARECDLVAVAPGNRGGGGTALHERAREATSLWRFVDNWRDLSGVARTASLPLSARDHRLAEPKFVTREPEKFGFLRPAAGQKWALQGAGRHDPALPRYVGAVPPAGVAAWDWEITWRARMRRPPPTGK